MKTEFIIKTEFLKIKLLNEGGAMQQKAGYILPSEETVEFLGQPIISYPEIVWSDMDFWTDLISTASTAFVDWYADYGNSVEIQHVIRAKSNFKEVREKIMELTPVLEILSQRAVLLHIFDPNFDFCSQVVKH